VAGVEDTSLFESLGNDWDGRVDGVGDDEDVSIWSNTGNSGSEVADNGGVGLCFNVNSAEEKINKSEPTLKRSSRVIYFNVQYKY